MSRGSPGTCLSIAAPAKVNLGLRMLGTRPDGYHLLESVFVPIDLRDDLEIRTWPASGAASVRLRVEAAPEAFALSLGDIPSDARNIAWRAAQAFVEAADLRVDVEIVLRKRVPSGAGLGGGSSDAGAVLRALDRSYPGRVEGASLAALALRLGADVPFFLDPRPSLVTGVGEGIEPLEALPALWLLLANPGESLATAQVYAAYDALSAALTPAPPGSTMRAVSDLRAANRDGTGRIGASVGSAGSARGDDPFREALDRLLTNDLEPAAIRLCPPVGRIRTQLREAGALAVGMSGSGATVFGVFGAQTEAQEAADRLGLGAAPSRGAEESADSGAAGVRAQDAAESAETPGRAEGSERSGGAQRSRSAGWTRIVRSAGCG